MCWTGFVRVNQEGVCDLMLSKAVGVHKLNFGMRRGYWHAIACQDPGGFRGMCVCVCVCVYPI